MAMATLVVWVAAAVTAVAAVGSPAGPCAAVPGAVRLQHMVAPLLAARAQVVPLELAPVMRRAYAACATDARRVSWAGCAAAGVVWGWPLPGFALCGLLGSLTVSVLDTVAPPASVSVGLWRVGWEPGPRDAVTCGGRRAAKAMRTARQTGPLGGTLVHLALQAHGPSTAPPAFNGTLSGDGPWFLRGAFAGWDPVHPAALATDVEVDAGGAVTRGTFHGMTCGLPLQNAPPLP